MCNLYHVGHCCPPSVAPPLFTDLCASVFCTPRHTQRCAVLILCFSAIDWTVMIDGHTGCEYAFSAHDASDSTANPGLVKCLIHGCGISWYNMSAAELLSTFIGHTEILCRMFIQLNLT